jgi:hypothetical protein
LTGRATFTCLHSSTGTALAFAPGTVPGDFLVWEDFIFASSIQATARDKSEICSTDSLDKRKPTPVDV